MIYKVTLQKNDRVFDVTSEEKNELCDRLKEYYSNDNFKSIKYFEDDKLVYSCDGSLKNLKIRTVYVPLLIYGREKYEYECDNSGVYTTLKEALHRLIDEMIKKGFLDLERYNDCLVKKDEDKLTFYSFSDKLKKLVNTIDDLKVVCEKYDNSFYEDGWKFEVNEFNIDI